MVVLVVLFGGLLIELVHAALSSLFPRGGIFG